MIENSKALINDKRQEIIKNAQIIFGKYGFSKTTLEDIAGHLGMKKNSLYYYFPSKEAIFEEVINQNFKKIFSRITEEIAEEKTAEDKLKRIFKISWKLIKEDKNPVSIHAAVDIHKSLIDLYKNYNSQSVSLISKIINDGIKSGEFRKCNPKEVAKSIINLNEAVKLREFYYSNAKYISEIDFKESEKTIKILIDLIIEGLKK